MCVWGGECMRVVFVCIGVCVHAMCVCGGGVQHACGVHAV